MCKLSLCPVSMSLVLWQTQDPRALLTSQAVRDPVSANKVEGHRGPLSISGLHMYKHQRVHLRMRACKIASVTSPYCILVKYLSGS